VIVILECPAILILAVFQPADDIESFFREYGELTGATPEYARQFYKSHGLDLLGPPLDVAAINHLCT
jgi:hypothetical protein